MRVGSRLALLALTLLILGWAGALAYLGLVRVNSDPTSSASGTRSPSQVEPQAGSFRGSRLPESVVGRKAPTIRLRDARGAAVDTRRLGGRPYVVTFLFTDCRDTCPVIAAELRRALELLGPRGRAAAVVAVTAKPETDTPVRVRRWLAHRGMPANFRFALGPRRSLERVWRSYYAAPQGTERQPHSSSIWLIDAEGRIRTKFSAGVPVPPRDIAHDLGLLIHEAKRG
jgi:protein SCO1